MSLSLGGWTMLKPTSFDFRNHTDKLTPGKEKDSYVCPICSGDRLTVNPRTGEYNCWHGCPVPDIRNAVAPLPKKSPRPQQQRTWDYYDKDGNLLIQVCRADDGKGTKKFNQKYYYRSQSTYNVPDNVKRQHGAAVMPYRYSEAIKHQQVVWVEGESTADALWAIGIPATTTIGGSEGLGRYGDYNGLFDGKDLIISPDLDQPGLKYGEAVAKLYPDAKWLYAFPQDPRWKNPPQKGGLDGLDWIESGASKADILGAVEVRRVVVAKDDKAAPIPSTAKISMAEMGDRIRDLIAQNLPSDELEAEKIELRSIGMASEREFERLWQSISERTESDVDVNSGIDLLLSAKQSNLDLSSVLPHSLANPIDQMAKWQSLKPELYLMSLLTATGSLAKNGTTLLLHQALEFEVTPNIFTAIVAEPSQKKSPVIRTMVKKPFRVLSNWAKDDYQLAKQQWENDKKTAENNKEPFTTPEPTQRVLSFTKASGESILRQAARFPEQGLLNISDELAGYFKSANQHRGGRGSDAEDLLEYYDGSGGTVLRVEGVQADVETLNYGLLGAIQPKVLQTFLGKCDDSNGSWSRFFFVQQPTTASTLPDDDLSFDISGLLTSIYGRINQFAPAQYRLEPKAFKLFQRCNDRLEQQKLADPDPAIRAVYGKTAGRIGKIALNLHLIDAAIANVQPGQLVSEATIKKAVAISKLAIDQIRALYCEFGGDDLTGNLAKVVDLSHRKGEIKARDVQRSFDKASCPTPATVRQWFAQLTEQGWGTLNGSGTGLTFTASQKQTMPVVDTQVSAEPSTTDTETLSAQSDEPGVFSKGDRVMVTDPKSEWRGMHGVIDRIEGTNGSSQYFVEGKNANGGSVATWLKKSQISLSIAPKGASEAGIKVGQEVVVTTPSSPHKGSIGEVRELIATSEEILYRVVRDYEGTPEKNFDATFPIGSVKPLAAKNYTWEPA